MRLYSQYYLQHCTQSHECMRLNSQWPVHSYTTLRLILPYVIEQSVQSHSGLDRGLYTHKQHYVKSWYVIGQSGQSYSGLDRGLYAYDIYNGIVQEIELLYRTIIKYVEKAIT